MNRDIDPRDLQQILRYEPDAGRLYWLNRPYSFFPLERAANAWNAKYAYSEAFTAYAKNGYLVGNIFYRRYYAHRVIWALVHGKWPDRDIDHINGDRADNRLCNLREATNAENAYNMKTPAHNTSGYKGVGWHVATQRWRAQITVDGAYKHLGMFDTAEEAHAAYVTAAEKNYGKFARPA